MCFLNTPSFVHLICKLLHLKIISIILYVVDSIQQALNKYSWLTLVLSGENVVGQTTLSIWEDKFR